SERVGVRERERECEAARSEHGERHERQRLRLAQTQNHHTTTVMRAARRSFTSFPKERCAAAESEPPVRLSAQVEAPVVAGHPVALRELEVARFEQLEAEPAADRVR